MCNLLPLFTRPFLLQNILQYYPAKESAKMKRISREAAWGILSNHKIVILGHGEASVEEHKKIIEGTLKIMPDIVKDMIKDKRIYVTECDEKQITWNDENTLQYDHLLDAFIEDGYLYFREYEKKYAITTAVYVIGLREVPDTCEINKGNAIQLLIDIMQFNDEPDNIMELNRYIDDIGIGEALDCIIRANCPHL